MCSKIAVSPSHFQKLYTIFDFMAISLEPSELETVQRILQLHFGGNKIIAYGSRVTGVNLTPSADLDIAVISEKPIPFEEMVAVEKAFAESGLPFRVDIMDWAKLPESIQKSIKKENEVIQEAE